MPTDITHLPTIASPEVLVCGGGTAGVVAAIAAARAGASVLIVEQLGQLGGTQSAGWVTPMMPNKMLEESLTHGINDEIIHRAAKIDPPPTERTGDLLWFNPITLALVLDDMMAEAGVRVLFHTFISDAIVEDGVLRGVIVENKDGRGAIEARVTIDSTGDADVALRAGAPTVSGDPEDGHNQPMSLRFAMAGVDQKGAAAFLVDEVGMNCYSRDPLFEIGAGEAKNTPLGPLIGKAIEAGVLAEDDLGYLQFFSMLGRPGELAFNCPRITGLSATSAWDLSQAQIVGRQKIRRIARFFKEYIGGFEGAYIGTIAPMVGVRESRRIVGDYTLTEDDFLSEARFPDAIARNSYPIDIHTAKSQKGLVMKYLPPGHYHEIPYRCLLPQGVENLLVAGRCLSATFAAQAAVRIQQNCRAFGEAAGLAAAMSVAQNISPRSIDTNELRRRLNAQGAQI
ncbi:MAG: FAD-dependent oxidoreductase [Capsulimonas sp.]|uniref:FAD-dependent oxidoreductase n=1 Tax=Capsulimonas sp. TaxID=2494211 RepID=UPI0032658C92